MVEDPAPAATPSTPAPAASTPAADESQKGLAAVAYILTWLTGLIIFLVAKKEQKYVRWNAVQAIGLGIVAVIIGILLNILGAAAAFGGGLGTFGALGLLSLVIWLAVIALIIILAVKAYQGTPIRLPFIADMADKYA